MSVINSDGYLYYYILDGSTGEVLFSLKTGKTYADGATQSLLAVSLWPLDNTLENPEPIKLLVDNVELLQYMPASYAPSMVSSSIANNATDISTDTTTLTVEFDQPLSTLSAKVGGTDCTMTAVSNKLNTYIVTLPALAGATAYTVDFTGSKNAGNAASDDTLTFTTAGTSGGAEETGQGIVTVVDNFEDSSLLVSSNDGYNIGSTDASPLMAERMGSGAGHTYLTENNGGYGETGKALVFKTDVAGGSSFKPLSTVVPYKAETYVDGDETINEQFVVTYRLMIDDAAEFQGTTTNSTGTKTYDNKGTRIWIGASNTGRALLASRTVAAISNYDANADGECEAQLYVYVPGAAFSTYVPIYEDIWYNITYKIDGNDHYCWFTNAMTGELVWQGYREITANGTDPIYISPFVGMRDVGTSANGSTYAYNHAQAVLIDDFTLYRIKPWLSDSALVTESASTDANSNISLSFNQPVVGKTGMLELYKGVAEGVGGALTNERIYAIPTIKYPDFCKQTVSFSNLEYMTAYTLDYSAMKGVSGADLGDNKATSLVEFTTAVAPEDISVVGEIECSGLTANSTISVDFYSKSAQSPTVLAAFYKRSFPAQLAAVEVEPNFALAEGKNSKTITLSKNIDADYIKLYAWEGMDTMRPLMEDYKALAPIDDTLDVLMIGNSLSEDAGYYLNDIATAGGLDLSLTVKGVGGSRLSHHRDNLARELSYHLDENYQDADKVAEYVAAVADIDRPLYFTYVNGEHQSATNENAKNQSATSENAKNQLLITALKEKQYDIISLQQLSSGYSDDDFEEPLKYLTAKIRELQPNAEIVIYQAWGGYTGRLSYFTNNIKPTTEKWAQEIGRSVANITADGDAMTIIPAGHAFYLTDESTDWAGIKYTQGDGNTGAGAQLNKSDAFNTAQGLYRDYNHASYYGCYLADAVWYEMLTGKRAPVTNSGGSAVIAKPTGYIAADPETQYCNISDAEHLERLQVLSDIAHTVCLEQRQ